MLYWHIPMNMKMGWYANSVDTDGNNVVFIAFRSTIAKLTDLDAFRGLADVAAGPLDEELLQAFHNITTGAIQRRHKWRLSMNQVESGHVYGVHNDCFAYTIYKWEALLCD